MTSAGVHVHRAERADGLVAGLAELLGAPLADPFATEVVAVGARGLERWLVQRLSHRLGAGSGGSGGDGVCAGIAFPSPAALVARALDVDGADPWTPQRMTWPLLEVIDACVGESWCEALTAHVTRRTGRRVAVARRLAERFAAYAEHRPEMLCAWAARDDDGEGAVPDDLAWQPELWRRLRARIGVPGPAEELAARCERLRTEPDAVDLPARLSLFGPVRLPARQLRVVAALAEHRAVHLWTVHPSPAQWSGAQWSADAGRAGGRSRPGAVEEAADPAGLAGGHPLLASLGRDLREQQQRVGALAADGVRVTDTHRPPPAPSRGADTVLGGLQDDLRHDRAPVLRPADGSLVVHACHGPDRQVEVLREAVVGLLARDETLEPRDVVVLCPDLDTYAPLITAAFGLGADHGHPGHRLPVRLADRSLRQGNPLLGFLARLLELADARVSAAEVLDLAESAPVRRRFAFDDDALDDLRELVARSGVRWGLDAEHRRPFGLAAYPQNSWAAGLDRLLLGVAMSEDDHRWLGTALPLDDVDSGLVDLVGRLAELVDRLATVLDGLTGERPLREWTDTLTAALDSLTSVPVSESWQTGQARAELSEVADGSTDAPLTLADVRAVLADRLAGRPERVIFGSGALTAATLAPLRAVPHRVVCLLGLDDGAFPREGAPDGDDLLALDPRVGEPDPRGEDRAMLLDAVGAATEHLVLVYSGFDERTGARRPPAVPLGELLDVVGPDVVRRHPLQPFDPRNFDASGPDAPFSFDAVALAGARRAARSRGEGGGEARPFLDGPLGRRDADETALDDLLRFVEHPVKGFLAQRLGVHPRGEDAEPDDALPVDPDPLTQWSVGDRLLSDRLAGASPEQCRQAEWRRGVLPPGTLGHRLLERIQASVEPLVELALPLRSDAARAVDVDLALDLGTPQVQPGGPPHRLVGTVGGLRGASLLTVTYSRLAAKHRLRAWVALLALTAQTGHELRAVTLGRGFRSSARSIVGPVAPARACGLLADLVALRAEGLCSPLPLATATACAYAERRARGDDPDDAREAAREKWDGRFGDGADESHRRVWGELTFDGFAHERFAVLAERVWRPLLAAERKDTP